MRESLKRVVQRMAPNGSGARLWVIPLSTWIVLTSASLAWNLYELRRNTLETFRVEAQTLVEMAWSMIQWTAHHEQVYVPLTEWVPMQPAFAELPAMEVVTTCGLRLTRMSHDVIIRQVAEQAHFQGWGRKTVRVTSLQPLNPINAPNAWERESLELFAGGKTERFALTGRGPDAMLKYMVPLRGTATLTQGYRAGDLWGGLSVREPAASRLAMIRPQLRGIIATHAGIFMVVAIAMLALLSRLRRQWVNLDQLNAEQREIIARLAESEARVSAMAITDELTGLKNRRGFFRLAEQQLRAANLQKTKLWFIFIDVDGMKAVNDQYGHSEGDRALTATAGILKNTFRESDVIARIGGDEFVVMITGTDESHGGVILDRLMSHLDLHNAATEQRFRRCLSAGIVYVNSGEKPWSVEELLKSADQLMYEAKRGKPHCRNCHDHGLEPCPW